MSSQASERIDKFHIDAQRWCTKNAQNDARCIEEMKKLSKWMLKHQAEIIPDSSKTKLQSIMFLFFSCPLSINATESILNEKINLLADYLKMPEGKLVTSKSKKKVMKWLDELNNTVINMNTVFDINAMATTSGDKWMVADIGDDDKLSLMRENVEDMGFLEGIVVTDTYMLQEIKRLFEIDGFCTITLSDDHCTVLEIIVTSDV